MDEPLRIVKLLETAWSDRLNQYNQSTDRIVKANMMGKGILAVTTALYCHPQSTYYLDDNTYDWIVHATEALLAEQLASGCISLNNCNIDSPPDTAFQVHGVVIVYQVMEKSGITTLEEVKEQLKQFLIKAKGCLLTGGVHTPNHRWVMCGALANLYEIFAEEALRERALQYFSEGFDITSYGEWTERSNAMYNSAIAVHLIDAAEVFGYSPAWEAVKMNLLMMQYMFHPDGTIATEYSGRQDFAQQTVMNDWYYTAFHIMATAEQDEVLQQLAYYAEQTAIVGANSLLYWMLYPEKMQLSREVNGAMPDNYTVFLGAGHEVPVPAHIPYVGKVVVHPHGAPLVRHRCGDLSVTIMSGQSDILYMQYKTQRMFGYRIGLGWFGIGTVAFPSIVQLTEKLYQLEVELEGCYFNPLPAADTAGLHGSYVQMPHEKRTKTHETKLRMQLQIEIVDDGVNITLQSDTVANIYVQHIFQFAETNQIAGAAVVQTEEPLIYRLSSDYAEVAAEESMFIIGPGDYQHLEVVPRNEFFNYKHKRLVINSITPLQQTITVRCQ